MLIALAAHRVVAAAVGDVDDQPRRDVAAPVEARSRLGTDDAELLVAIGADIVDPAVMDGERPARLVAARLVDFALWIGGRDVGDGRIGTTCGQGGHQPDGPIGHGDSVTHDVILGYDGVRMIADSRGSAPNRAA